MFVYDLETGALLNTISIAGEPFPGGASCLTFDQEGNLVDVCSETKGTPIAASMNKDAW